jgi:serine/threonine protein kinase
MAPEVVKHYHYTKKADIWSLGCLIIEMFTGTHPWAGLEQMQAMYRVSLFFVVVFIIDVHGFQRIIKVIFRPF